MDKTKNIILWICTIFILISTFTINNKIVQFLCISISIIVPLYIIYKDAPQITNLSNENVKIKTVRNTIIMSLLFLFSITLVNLFLKIPSKLAENINLALITIFFICFGNISPKLPRNSYLGFRLPWTVSDEETWRYAHRLIGYVSFPGSIIMFLVGFYYNIGFGVLLGVFIIVLIPSILSYKFYKKLYGIKQDK